VPGISKSVHLVRKRQERMTEQHPWTGVAHDLPSLGSLGRLVTVDRAVGASRFVVTIGAFLQTHFGIVEKCLTGRTQKAHGRIMVIGAVDADHFLHRHQFTIKVFLLRMHLDPAVGIQV
jgi:hypothetical protein